MNRITLNAVFLVAASAASAHAAPLVRGGAGADAAGIQAIVDQFRADMGGVNNGVGGGPFAGGRREINWDAPALDAFAFPNNMPNDFFNRTPGGSPRGAEFTTPDGEGFYVSFRDAGGNAANPNNRFGDINPQYNTIFQAFSQQRLFAVDGGITTDVHFFVPSSPDTAAFVRGFGAVFADVDSATDTSIEFYGLNNELLFAQAVAPANNGLSFLGVSFDAGEQVGRVRIRTGNASLSALNNDGFFDDLGLVDVVAMDDFFYSEPQAVPTPTALALGVIAVAASGRRRRR